MTAGKVFAGGGGELLHDAWKAGAVCLQAQPWQRNDSANLPAQEVNNGGLPPGQHWHNRRRQMRFIYQSKSVVTQRSQIDLLGEGGRYLARNRRQLAGKNLMVFYGPPHW